jgi:hypothetical protein
MIFAMKPLERLLGKTPPPPPPPTLAERIAALQAAPAEAVLEAALGGDEAGLRIGAIHLLPDGEALRALAGLTDPPQGAGTPPAVRHAAHERLARLVDEGSVDFAALRSDPAHRLDSLAVASLCRDPDHLREALARIDDPAVMASLVVEGPSSRVRQSAAAAIEDPAQLHELLPRVRGKDKTVYKIIRQKCDALLAERRRAEELARETAEVCESLEEHAARPHGALYAAALANLTARWRALAPRPDPEIEQRGEQAIERCREVIAAHEREVARQAAELAAERAAREERERAQQAERLAEQRAAEERAEAEARTAAAAAEAREAEERVRAEQQASEAHAVRELGGLIRLARVALQTGNSRKAARFRQAIEDALQAVPAAPADLARQLHQLDEKLNELRQWKDYVVAPKRLELIEEMEALVGAQEDPAELAEHIRALQQEWRTINKGIVIDASAEGERFQKAHQAAFKPCQAYFAAQGVVRRENLEARKQVLERLKAFEASEDPEHPDYKLIGQVLREAPREWRRHSPVDPDASRPAEIEFQRSMDRLRKILAGWYERNEADKNALIAQARQLSTLEDTSQAIEGVKRLNVLWKETGPVSRDRSQALWDEFRGLCDAVFQRREQAYAQHSAGLVAARTQAVALCEQVEQANGAPAMERLAAHAQIREWRAAFDGIGELPRADARGLRDRFERALSRFETALADQDRRDLEAAGSNLLEAGRQIRAYERAVMQDAPPDDSAALKSAAEAFMAGVHRWPKGGLQALKQALARADSASSADEAARERTLRTLCIRCEIASSTPTPPGDQELRREYQMRLLMERMGQASAMVDQDWDAMLLEWIGIGAVAPEIHEELQQRFMRCLANRPAKISREPRYQDYPGERRPARDRDDRNARRDGRGRPDGGGRR